MKQQEKLFLLIKSLSKGEKRHFKLYASKYSKEGDSNYNKLFDAIEQQAEYDETSIKEAFKNEKFVKQLTVTKNYLYNLILESLRSTNAGLSIETVLRDHLKDVEILYSKALYPQCTQLLSKAKVIAIKHNKFTTTLEIIEWEQRVRMREAGLKELETHLEEAHQEEQKHLRILQNRLDMKFLARKMLVHSRKIWIANTEEDIKPFNEIIQHPLLSHPSQALSLISLFEYYNTHAIYNRVKDVPEKLYEFRKKGVELIESNPEYRDADPEVYFVALNNFIYACINIGLYKEALDTLPQMYAIRALSEDIHNLIHSSARNLELALYFHIGEFEKGVERIEELEKEFGDLDKYMPPNQRTAYFFYNSNLYFGKGDYHKALYWINKVLDYKEEGYRQDIHRFARILNLIIHYELENHEQIEYFAKSTYRFLYARERLFHAETLVFEFLKKSIKVNDPRKMIDLFSEYKELFEKLYENKFEKKIFEYIDLVTWLESKIRNVRYGELAHEKKKKLIVNVRHEVS